MKGESFLGVRFSRQGLVDFHSRSWPWPWVLLPQPPKAGVAGMCHHTQMKNNFIKGILCVVKLAVIERELFLSSLSFTTLSKLRTVRCCCRTTRLSEEQNCRLLLQDSHMALGGAELSATAAPQPHGSLELFFVNILRSFDF